MKENNSLRWNRRTVEEVEEGTEEEGSRNPEKTENTNNYLDKEMR